MWYRRMWKQPYTSHYFTSQACTQIKSYNIGYTKLLLHRSQKSATYGFFWTLSWSPK
jgi:hypothetical protein